MTATKVQLVGGAFQDSEGNLLSYGYLEMKLSQDENVSGVGQIASGIEIKVLLDGNASVQGTSALTLSAVATSIGPSAVYTGTITGGDNNAFVGLTFTVASFTTGANNGTFLCTASTATTLTLANASASAESHAATATAIQAVWGNDQMLPTNSYYRVTGYTVLGQPAWGPNNQQVSGSGGTYDVGTWVPNQVLSWTPALQPLLLETNGSENAQQFVLNFEDSASVAWSVDGSGNLQATAAVGGLDVKTNSVDNTSQAVLNFEDTASVTWSNPSGGIVKATVAVGPPFSVAGQGYFFGPGVFRPELSNEIQSTALANSANQVVVTQFILPFSVTLRNCSWYQNGLTTGKHHAFGIYSSTGNLLVDSGPVAFSGSPGTNTSSFSPVTLLAGIYWLAQTSEDGADSGYGTGGVTSNAGWVNLFNLLSTHFGSAANPSIAGQLPATLGAITVFSGPQTAGIAYPLWEP